MQKRDDINRVMIIGSGPIVIGQACEFDYSGTQACKALRSLGYKIILVNSNPATIMTDPGMADITYIEPLNFNRMKEIIVQERPDALLPNLGGQSGLNLSSELYRAGVLKEYGVNSLTKSRLTSVGKGRVSFINDENEDLQLETDAVVLAKRVANQDLYDFIELNSDEFHVVGDAVRPGFQVTAIHGGHRLGCKI